MVHSEIYLKTQEIENRPLNRRVEKDKREESNIPMVWRKNKQWILSTVTHAGLLKAQGTSSFLNQMEVPI